MDDPHASTPRGSRKFAVSLFADLTGYTALCERLDPEDVERAVAPLMAGMHDAVTAESGVVLNVAGDGIFAIFGAPEALADSPERAIRVAQQMRAVVADMNGQVHGIALPDVHIGIAAGEVLLTRVAQQGSWSVIGTSVNLASRLCDAASAGEILVDDGCHRLVRTGYSWQSARTLSLKGQTAPTLAWPLAATSTSPIQQTLPQVFVGRTGQLSALNAELEAVTATRTSRIVVIRGLAGIGKSCLVQHWLSLRPEIDSWQIECDESRRRDDLQTLNDALNGTNEDLTSSGSGRLPSVDRSDPYPLVVHALRASLKEAVGGRPRVLVIDNLHASDTILGEFLLELSKEPLSEPLLVVATWRDESTGITTEPYLLGRALPIEPLDRDQSDALFEAILGESADRNTLELVAARAVGHPLMVCESAMQLVELRKRAAERGGDPEQEFRDSLPTSLRMFLAARIDRLDPAARAVVHDLSTLGAHFSSLWVRTVLGRRAEDLLPRLAKEGVLTYSEDWSFSHDLLRDVAYSTLTRAQRGDIHRRQLGLLSPTADPHERASHAVAWNEAVSAVEREQYVESTVAAVRESLALSRELYARQARAALEAARRATSAARDCVALEPGLSSQLWSLEARCLSELGLNDQALSLAAQAERTAAEADMPALQLAPMMTSGYVLSTLRRFESARQILDTAAQLSEALGDRTSQAEAIRLLADTWRHSLIGRYLSLTEEAYHLFDVAGDHRGAGQCARTLAYEYSVGRLAPYARWRAIAASHTEGDDLRATAGLAKADALAMGGRFRWADQEAASRSLVEAGETLEAPDLLSEGLLNLAEGQIHLGKPQDALAASVRLVDLATALGDRRMRAAAAAAAIQPALRTGDLSRSLEELRVAKEMATDFGLGEEVFIASAAGVALSDRGHWEPALATLQSNLEAHGAGGFALAALAIRAEEVRIAGVTAQPSMVNAVSQLVADASDLDAPLVVSYAIALDAWSRAAHGDVVQIDAAPDDACLEESAIRADTAALRLELGGSDSASAWREARALWERLGYTIWLARAQARAGDLDAARHTLDVLDSPAEARAWALGEAAAP